MATTITIYGTSDDLVEVEGNVPGCNEYNAIDKPQYVELSTGDVFKIEYTDRGVWTVERAVKGKKKVVVRKEPHGEGDDPEPYTEKVDVLGPIEWVEVWDSWPVTDDEISGKIAEEFGVGSGDDLPVCFDAEDRRKIWDIISASKRRQ